MLFSNPKIQSIRIDKDLYKRCRSFLQKDRSRRYQAQDSDKDLEFDILKSIFSKNWDLRAPRNLQEEYSEIDAYLCGESIQLKCRSDIKYLTLEDYKTTRTGEKTSWVDRSIAQYTLFVEIAYPPYLNYILYETSDLKRLLNLLRERERSEFDEIDLIWLNKFFPNWQFSAKSISTTSDGMTSSIYKVLIN